MRHAGGRDKWLKVIGSVKLLKGLLLLALAAGALNLLRPNVAAQLTEWIERLSVDPRSHYFRAIAGKLAGLDSRKVLLWTVGTFCYGALFVTEGIGLLLARRWAEYFSAIITGSFLPLEIYELARKFSVLKLIVIIVNTAIFVYLVWRLKTEKPKPAKS
jgi:uncharacterized membrane protein (DUF2068 family)